MPERDSEEIPVVKEEETNDAEGFGGVGVEMASALEEPKAKPPPGSSMVPPGTSSIKKKSLLSVEHNTKTAK